MAVVIIEDLINDEELATAGEEYESYIKVVVDIVNEVMAVGGEWHADAERELLGWGSKQENLWGGGLDLTTGEVDYISLINTRPNLNRSQEVSDSTIREKMFSIIKKMLHRYVKEG